MIGHEAALELILAAAPAREACNIKIETAHRLTAASDVRASIPVPHFANAAMDGYALRSSETRRAAADSPVEFTVIGQIAAGSPSPTQPTPTGCAWEIMTGAPMPGDCDAVVPVERSEACESRAGKAVIRIRGTVSAGQNRRLPGEDFAPGDLIVEAGDEISPQTVMGLAANGFDSLQVRRTPRIALITTGSELAASGSPTAGSLIRDANGPYIASMLDALGLELSARHSVGDDAAEFVHTLDSLSQSCDVVLTTGGVSAGRFDIVPAAMKQLQAQIVFHKVAIRPGKPLLFARLRSGTLLFGLPGNPMAVAVGFRFFVLPALRSLAGRPAESWFPALCREPIRRHASMTFFAKAQARLSASATLEVQLLPGQESFRISPLLRANCWAIVPPGEKPVGAGEVLRIAPLLPGIFPAA